MITFYGLKTCDACRKARKWLDSNEIDYVSRDVREDGVDAVELRCWADSVGWESLLNRRSTSWRALPETDRRDLDIDKAVSLMHHNPTLIKRPILIAGDTVLVGFDDVTRQEILSFAADGE